MQTPDSAKSILAFEEAINVNRDPDNPNYRGPLQSGVLDQTATSRVPAEATRCRPERESECFSKLEPVGSYFRPRRPRPINRDADDMSRDQIDPIQERVERGEVPYPECQALNSIIRN